MYCSSCGKQIADTAKFCPYCGNMTGAATTPAAPVPSESVINPQPAPRKRLNILSIILIAAAAVVLIAVVAVISVLNAPAAKLTRAFSKTAAAYTDALEGLGLPELTQVSEGQEFGSSLTLELTDINADYVGQIPTGIGLRYQGAYSIPDRDISMVLTPYYGSVDLLTVEAAIHDSFVYVHAPDVLGNDYYGINTATLGADLVRQGLAESDMEALSFNVFDLIALSQELAQPSEEAVDALKDAAETLTKSVSIKKSDSATLNVNGYRTECTGYTVTIPKAALEAFFHAVEVYSASMDHEAIFREFFLAMGLPRDMIDDTIDELDLSSSSDLFDDLKDVLEELGDVVLNIYLSDGYVSAISWERELNGEAAGLTLYLGGGSDYVDDLSLVLSADGDSLRLSSSGNHSGKNSTYTDTTIFEVTEYGETYTAFQSVCSYSPEEDQDNFQWSVSTEGMSADIAGQLNMDRDSLRVDLDTISLHAFGEEMMAFALSYSMDAYAPLLEIDNGIMVLEMSDDELSELSNNVQTNLITWVYGLMTQIPELINIIS